jgi:hypothetical protein
VPGVREFINLTKLVFKNFRHFKYLKNYITEIPGSLPSNSGYINPTYVI